MFNKCSSDYDLVYPSRNTSLNYLIISHSFKEHIICFYSMNSLPLIVNFLLDNFSKVLFDWQNRDVFIIWIVLQKICLLMKETLKYDDFRSFQVKIFLKGFKRSSLNKSLRKLIFFIELTKPHCHLLYLFWSSFTLADIIYLEIIQKVLCFCQAGQLMQTKKPKEWKSFWKIICLLLYNYVQLKWNHRDDEVDIFRIWRLFCREFLPTNYFPIFKSSHKLFI